MQGGRARIRFRSSPARPFDTRLRQEYSMTRQRSRRSACCLLILGATVVVTGRQQPKEWTAVEDHRQMMEQLGIRSLRPGPSGNEQAPNHANYDEALANPFPTLPEVLTLKNGRKVTTADTWWKQRRPEIVEDFEREVFGRVPASVPVVKWELKQTAHAQVAGLPVIAKQLVGHVDNSTYPAITVDIQMTVVTPANANSKVPVLM